MGQISKVEALQRKQSCANNLQDIVIKQVAVLRKIKDLNYEPTPQLKSALAALIIDYDSAVKTLEAASENCHEPVYVKPVH